MTPQRQPEADYAEGKLRQSDADNEPMPDRVARRDHQTHAEHEHHRAHALPHQRVIGLREVVPVEPLVWVTDRPDGEY